MIRWTYLYAGCFEKHKTKIEGIIKIAILLLKNYSSTIKLTQYFKAQWKKAYIVNPNRFLNVYRGKVL